MKILKFKVLATLLIITLMPLAVFAQKEKPELSEWNFRLSPDLLVLKELSTGLLYPPIYLIFNNQNMILTFPSEKLQHI
jgi:hypothetical protein